MGNDRVCPSASVKTSRPSNTAGIRWGRKRGLTEGSKEKLKQKETKETKTGKD